MIKIITNSMKFFGSQRLFSLVAAIVGLTLIPCFTFAAPPFYEGKTLRFIVGYPPGGGYDTYTRMVARHIGKHLPGNPTTMVENMPGAAGLISGNYVYRIAKPDGLTILHWDAAMFIFAQLMGQPGVEFDARKFEHIGAPTIEDDICVFSKASGITSVDKWMASKTPVKMGGIATGSFTPNNLTRLLKATTDFPINLIEGYKGTADIRLAVESGELAGQANDWYSMKVTWRHLLDAGDVVPVLQVCPKPLPDLPNVPLVNDFLKSDEARQLIQVGNYDPRLIERVFGAPPGTPKERMETLRKAFQETLRDKEFLGEAEKARWVIIPVTGEEIDKAAARMFNLNPAMLAKLKEIFYK